MPRESKLPAPTAKDINEAHRLARSSAETAIQHAIRCGKMLATKKVSVKHGEFERWVVQNCEFSDRQARRYMQAAVKTDTRVRFDSLRQLLGVENKQKKREPVTPPAQPSPSPQAQQPSAVVVDLQKPGQHATKPTPSPVEVIPAPDFDFTDYEPEDDDACKANVENVMMADDKLLAMYEELKKVHREMQGLKASRDHYQSQAGEAVRFVKARDREIEKLKRDLARAREENEALRERVAIMETAAA
jgi:hypothetical protein